MSSILEWLPFLEGWEWKYIELHDQQLQRGKSSTLFDLKGCKGWLISALYMTNSPSFQWNIDVETTAKRSMSLKIKPNDIYALGLNVSNHSFPYYLIYNPALKVYVIAYTPIRGWQFNGDVYVTASLPQDVMETSCSYSIMVNLAFVTSTEQFISSWRKIHT